MLRIFSACFCLLLLTQNFASAEDKSGQASAESLAFFTQKVEPIFQEYCYSCHGNGKNKGGLSFYTRENLVKGGDSGSGINVEDLNASLILEAVRYSSFEMPPSGKLPQEKIDLIEQWVKSGAPIPTRTDVIQIHHGVPEVNDENRRHWAFQPVRDVKVPELKSDWVRTPIDAFILKTLQENQLSPNPPADPRALIRRVTYDITGLPPTLEDVEAFAADPSQAAYEKLVDRLLDSPHYGEHWARYWLDLVRYAESNSFERDNPKPFVWKYRDYVIQAFNKDLPYDEFLLQQLAGDELPSPTPDDLIATGFYRLGPWDDEPADPQLARYDELDDIVSTVGQGFLGLTLNCARCHDHKLDPLPISDYYSFVAFFQNTQRFGIRNEQSVYQRSIRDVGTPEEKALHAEQLKKYEDRINLLRSKLDELEQRVQPLLPGGERDDFMADSVRQRILNKYIGKHLTEEEFKQYARRRAEWNKLRNNPPKSAQQVLCITEGGAEAPKTFVLIRGNPGAEGDEVQPAFPQILSAPAPQIEPPEGKQSSGRRLALARWITSPENPLTARVMVNRIWQWHFDDAIVRSPNNFGLTADAPTHPELLDWLASDFVKNGWKIKRLHRQILLSNAYQMSSAANPVALEKDPQNSLRWRYNLRRLRAEEIRDSILSMNRTLKVNEMFGPSIYPQLPAAVLAGQSMPGHNWPTSTPDDSARRSIYIHIKRSVQVPLLASFDVADTDFTCPVRFATTQPTQALGMMNSEFINEQAKIFADDLRKQAGNDLVAQIRLGLSRVLQRSPSEAEVARGKTLVEKLKSSDNQSEETALKSLCVVMLNLNEAIYLD